MVEECMADFAAPILRKEHALTEVEETGGVHTPLFKRSAEGLALGPHGRGGRGADKVFVIERCNDHRVRRPGKLAKVVRLVEKVPFVEIGPSGENLDTKASEPR